MVFSGSNFPLNQSSERFIPRVERKSLLFYRSVSLDLQCLTCIRKLVSSAVQKNTPIGPMARKGPLKRFYTYPMTDPNGAAIYGNMDPINIPPMSYMVYKCIYANIGGILIR